MKKLDVFTFRCIKRSICDYQIRVPITNNFILDKADGKVELYTLMNVNQVIWSPQDAQKKPTCIIEEEKN